MEAYSIMTVIGFLTCVIFVFLLPLHYPVTGGGFLYSFL